MKIHVKEVKDINSVYYNTDNTIEKLFDKGGYKLIAKKADGRLQSGYTKLMTERSRKIWIRYLRWRWRHNHPEYIKKQNSNWWLIYKDTKPCVCVCKKCGKSFNAPRNQYHICPECHNLPSAHQIRMQNILERREKKLKMIEEIKLMYKNGITQQTIANMYGVAQKTVSNWINDK